MKYDARGGRLCSLEAVYLSVTGGGHIRRADVGVVNLRGVLGQISALHAVQIGPLPRQVPSERGDLRLEVPELEKRVPQKLACLILRRDRRWVRDGEKGLTIQPLPCEYASFCASAHLFKNASDALN